MIDFHPDLPASPLNFAASINNFPDKIKDQMPDSYPYLWAKCSLMVQLGFEQYSQRDYFKFPLMVWITENYKSVVLQVVNDLRGFCPEFPLIVSNDETIYHLLFTLHFRINSIATDPKNIIQVDAIHLLEDDEITLYFTTKAEAEL